MSNPTTFLIYKPYGMLSQFTPDHPGQRTLGELGDFPPDVYPVGRLDKDSEGLLLLTNDKRLQHRLLDPKFGHERTYWVQVEGIPEAAALDRLRKGVDIRINKQHYRTRPAKASLLPSAQTDVLPRRNPPIRFRKNVPDTWIALTLTEGKNRQVRRMCAAVGYPVLRLVRVGIAKISLSDLEGSQVKVIAQKVF